MAIMRVAAAAAVWVVAGSGVSLAGAAAYPTACSGGVAAVVDGEFYDDWGGGLIWLAVPEAGTGGNEAVRAAVAESGGHATLIRAPAELRSAVPVFQPQDPGLARLSQRLKEGFDPRGILNPGRMYPGV